MESTLEAIRLRMSWGVSVLVVSGPPDVRQWSFEDGTWKDNLQSPIVRVPSGVWALNPRNGTQSSTRVQLLQGGEELLPVILLAVAKWRVPSSSTLGSLGCVSASPR